MRVLVIYHSNCKETKTVFTDIEKGYERVRNLQQVGYNVDYRIEWI